MARLALLSWFLFQKLKLLKSNFLNVSSASCLNCHSDHFCLQQSWTTWQSEVLWLLYLCMNFKQFSTSLQWLQTACPSMPLCPVLCLIVISFQHFDVFCCTLITERSVKVGALWCSSLRHHQCCMQLSTRLSDHVTWPSGGLYGGQVVKWLGGWWCLACHLHWVEIPFVV